MVSTRTNSYGPDSEQEAQGPSTSPVTLLGRRQRWAQLLRIQQFEPLIVQVLERELPKYAGSSILPASLSLILRECILILASTPLTIAAAVDGTLTQRFLIDTELQCEYSTIQERAHIQPSIYIHLLVDEQGLAPSANQYSLIREKVLKYISSGSEYQELAWQIDNVTSPVVHRSATASGHRKYLWTFHRSPQHVDTLRRFCDGVSHRVSETPPSERDTPMRCPPAECGYSINSHVRLAQHRHRQSSNYVMNLVEDICAYLYKVGIFKQHFSMHPFIIYLIFRPQQAAIAEIFISGLLQVWIEEGGGLNAYPAGRSVASARQLTSAEWVEHEKWISDNTDLIRNVRVQRERLEGDVLWIDREMGDAWRDALDSEGDEDVEDPRDLDYVPEEFAEEFERLGVDGRL